MAECQLADKPLEPLLTGFGVQFNQHVFAPMSALPSQRFDELEHHVQALAPQFVRIFFNDKYEGVPFQHGLAKSPENRPQNAKQASNWDSFARTVKLAQDAKATINVTWQSGPLSSTKAGERSMVRFARALELLAAGGATNLRWVTIQNEPNTAPGRPKKKPGQATAPKPKKEVTPERLDEMYGTLDTLLTAKGLRKQIRFMGGDLIEGHQKGKPDPFNLDQAIWFEHMSHSIDHLLDAYSAHIYWDYQDNVSRFRQRLGDVRRIIDGLNHTKPHPKPLFITEFGVRSADRVVKGKRNGVDPGNFKDGTPLWRTNIAAFQHAWFLIEAVQAGVLGAIKWDCFVGKYDDSANQAYYAIGPPGNEGWELGAMYFLLRLFTITTATGWRVRPVTVPKGSSKHLVAFQGGAGELTVVGLDHGGAMLNVQANTPPVDYEIGGLPKNAQLSLVLWNKAGGGQLVLDSTHDTGGSGVANVSVPLHSVFALTSKKLPAI